jgi:hypothetical protein
MDSGIEKNEQSKRQEVFSKSVRAGKRTYFFDVKSTKGNDFYITITESKKRPDKNGNGFNYEKHKIFLYKEDFEKFVEGLNETILKINELKEKGSIAGQITSTSASANGNSQYTSVDFDDLGQ